MRYLLLAALTLHAQNWPSFRGPGARGIAEKQNLPVAWDVAKGTNIAWKTEIPGLGLSSPIVWASQIFLTTAISGNPNMIFEATLKGELDRRQDEAEQEFRVIAVDRKSGKILWNVAAAKSKPRVLRHPHNSYASPTPATDGKYLVAFFGSEGLYCFDLKGKLLWKKDMGAMDQGAFDLPDYQWGSAASPVLWQGKVLLQVDMHTGSYLAALDAATGKELWRTPRDSKPSWSTPTVIEGAKRTEIVANGVEHVCGYDAETGRELWRLKGTSMISVPTPFAHNGLIYVFSGYSRNIRRSYAIRPGASGDITGSKEALAWMREEAPYLSTPVIAGGQLFTYSTRGGILAAYDANSGATIYQQRLGVGTPASASMVAADGIVYAPNEDGEVYVFKPGAKYEQVAVNTMGETVMATPAISGGTLFIRGARHLFAIRR
ncbi:MAG: PQQ-binding-like beta-propeller repeat protein [Acidobacteria bacterium]|nr:PQQ-binding-like beta-propeller repeat protein [Acidobacteriota bacterium]